MAKYYTLKKLIMSTRYEDTGVCHGVSWQSLCPTELASKREKLINPCQCNNVGLDGTGHLYQDFSLFFCSNNDRVKEANGTDASSSVFPCLSATCCSTVSMRWSQIQATFPFSLIGGDDFRPPMHLLWLAKLSAVLIFYECWPGGGTAGYCSINLD